MNEYAWRDKGYADVKAIVVDGRVDYVNDPQILELLSQGWQVMDENMFGQGLEDVATVVVFVK